MDRLTDKCRQKDRQVNGSRVINSNTCKFYGAVSKGKSGEERTGSFDQLLQSAKGAAATADAKL